MSDRRTFSTETSPPQADGVMSARGGDARTGEKQPAGAVCGVVVTFRPDGQFGERLAKIAAQVQGLVIVDNGTEGFTPESLLQAFSTAMPCTAVCNKRNLGVAAALNQGVRHALSSGFAWIATFDQDSVPEAGMVSRLREAWIPHPSPETLMVAGPQTHFYRSSRPAPMPPARGRAWAEVTHVITSGSLFRGDAFARAGFFDERLFVDYVDIEFCLRLRSRGYGVIQVREAVLRHSMGSLEERTLCGRIVHPTHHDPLRRYYQFRNALLLHRHFGETQPDWRRTNRRILAKILLLILIYERRRWQSLRCIARGVMHGLQGRAGEGGETPFPGILGWEDPTA